MELTSQLGRTGVVVGTCGFGGIPVGRDHLNDQEGADIVRRAIDEGIQLIDTFSAYGRSEIRIGMALKGRRDKIILVTKSRSAYAPDAFEETFNASLRDMQVECVDFLLLKNTDDHERVENTDRLVPVLDKLREQGKIRFTGISAHSPEHAMKMVEKGFIDVAEVPYNFANPAFKPVLDLCVARDVGVLAMKPLGGGRLFKEGVEKGAPETLDTLVNALSYALSHPSNPVLIPGIGSQAEMDRYLEAIPRLRRLSSDERTRLAENAVDFGDDFCRACAYCTAVCPSDIPIEKILPLLDRARHVRTDGTYDQTLKNRFVELGVSPDACVECGKCIEACPFNLPVPDRLREAFETFG